MPRQQYKVLVLNQDDEDATIWQRRLSRQYKLWWRYAGTLQSPSQGATKLYHCVVLLERIDPPAMQEGEWERKGGEAKYAND